MLRRRTSSSWLTVAQRNVAGSTPGSSRMSWPQASSRRNKSVTCLGLGRCLQVERHALDQPGQEFERLLERPVQEPGIARPDPADRVGRHAIVEKPQARVDRGLAAPRIVNPLAGLLSPTRSLTGISRAPGSMPNGGTWVAGIEGSRYLASTTRFRTRTVVVSPVSRDVNRRPSRAAL